jgi:hypothetical protein
VRSVPAGLSSFIRPRLNRKPQSVLSEQLERRRLLDGDLHVHDEYCGNNLPHSPPELTFPSGGPEYQIGDRWVTTAHGSAGSQGTGIRLTWSIVNDGVNIPGFNGEPASPSVLKARLNALYGSEATWLPLITSVFDAWGAITGNTYIYQPTDDGAAFGSAAGVLGVRGDIRIGSHPIDGASNVLAYNFFPDNADMVLDANDLQGGGYMANTANNSRRLRNVTAHEHGHGLGFNHVDPINGTKLMEAFASTSFDSIQFDDMLAGNRNYGDRLEKLGGNNSAATATDLGTLVDGVTMQDNLSVATTNDSDWFRINVPSNKNVTYTLAPFGPTYMQGPQGGATASFNAMAQMDLQITILASNGTTVITSANATGVGQQELINNFTLAAGTYYVRVEDAPGATNSAQMYRLTQGVGPGGAVVQSTMVPVSPDPRTSPVSSIAINFTEAINPATFDLSDFTFSREGNTEPLTGATLTSGDNISWTLGNLDSLTDRAGSYTITMGNNIFTPDGRQLDAGETDSWLMTAVTGTSGNDTIRIARIAGQVSVFINNPGPTPNYTISTTTLPSYSVLPLGGDDLLQVDYTGTNITGANGVITYDGGSGNDTLQVRGANANDQWNVTATSAARVSPVSTVNHSNVEAIDMLQGRFNVNADLNGLDANVGATATSTFNTSQHLDALTVAGSAVFPANGNRLMAVKSLGIAGAAAKLDLHDNDLLLDYTGASQLAAVQALINSARNGGDWLGATGLTSSAARDHANSITTLGAMEGSDYLSLGNTTFGGTNDAVDSTMVLVKYTYYADTDFNGSVDGDDYSRIDNGFNGGLGGWLNGDADGNGFVDGDDYSLIDAAFNLQGAVL